MTKSKKSKFLSAHPQTVFCLLSKNPSPKTNKESNQLQYDIKWASLSPILDPIYFNFEDTRKLQYY